MPKEAKTMLIPKVSNAYSLTIVKKLKDINYTTLEAICHYSCDVIFDEFTNSNKEKMASSLDFGISLLL